MPNQLPNNPTTENEGVAESIAKTAKLAAEWNECSEESREESIDDFIRESCDIFYDLGLLASLNGEQGTFAVYEPI